MTRYLFGLGAFLLCVYAIAVVAMYFSQRAFVYPGDPTRVAPVALGLTSVIEQRLATPDGAELIVWRRQPAPGKPTLLYFHGNGGNLASRAYRIQQFANAGLGLFMMSYRSYSGSTGTPDEDTIMADARLAYDALRQDGVPARQIIAYGESLGTGVATILSADPDVAVGAVILDAPYTRLPDVAARRYWFLPVSWLSTEWFASIEHIGQINAPLLVLHGSEDPLIPHQMGKRLFDAAGEPKTFRLFDGGHHSDLYRFGAIDAVEAFVDEHFGTTDAVAESAPRAD